MAMIKGIHDVGSIDRSVLLWYNDILRGWLVASMFTSKEADARISH